MWGGSSRVVALFPVKWDLAGVVATVEEVCFEGERHEGVEPHSVILAEYGDTAAKVGMHCYESQG